MCYVLCIKVVSSRKKLTYITNNIYCVARWFYKHVGNALKFAAKKIYLLKLLRD